MSTHSSRRMMGSADVIIIGGGVVGLATAIEAAASGLAVELLDVECPGAASRASAGLIGPTLEPLHHSIASFFIDAAKGYPAFLDELTALSGRSVPVEWGILEVAPDERSLERLVAADSPESTPIDERTLRELEPELVAGVGAVMHTIDGWLNPVTLVDALAASAAQLGNIRCVRVHVQAIECTEHEIEVKTDGDSHHAPAVVLAAGAWSSQIEGLPTIIPVTPARGQLLAFQGEHSLHHPTMYGDRYLVPRGPSVVAGSTMEHVGFDPNTTDDAMNGLEAVAERLVPQVVSRSTRKHGWAGLRPVTPDLLPVIGRDPTNRRLIYACGHSRNGILLAQSTACAVTELLTGTPPSVDLEPFSIARFAAGNSPAH